MIRARHRTLALVVLGSAACVAGTQGRTAPTAVPVEVSSVAPAPPLPTDPSSAPSSEPPAPGGAGSCGLRATLRRTSSQPGDPRYTLTLTNAGEAPVRLVLPGDGSESGWRTPTLTWLATANGKAVAAAPVGRCGLMNPIATHEIFTLARGASREITDWVGTPYFASGTYDLRLRYRNDPTLASRKGAADPSVAAELARTSLCEVTTNALRVTLP